jgi:hypothetical protein
LGLEATLQGEAQLLLGRRIEGGAAVHACSTLLLLSNSTRARQMYRKAPTRQAKTMLPAILLLSQAAGLALSGTTSPAGPAPLNFQAPPSSAVPLYPPVEVYARFPQVGGYCEGVRVLRRCEWGL